MIKDRETKRAAYACVGGLELLATEKDICLHAGYVASFVIMMLVLIPITDRLTTNLNYFSRSTSALSSMGSNLKEMETVSFISFLLSFSHHTSLLFDFILQTCRTTRRLWDIKAIHGGYWSQSMQKDQDEEYRQRLLKRYNKVRSISGSLYMKSGRGTEGEEHN